MMRMLLTAVAGLSVSLTSVASDVTVRAVELKGKDGVTLKATLYGSKQQGPAVMLFHQCNRDRGSWEQLARMLAGEGFHVLAMDYRGFGESGGTRFNQASQAERTEWVNTTWPEDIDIALAHLLSQPGVEKASIGAAGASCGVNQSIQLARRHPEVKSVVLLSGGTNRDGRKFLRSADLPVLGAAAADDGDAVVLMEWLSDASPHAASRIIRYDKGGHGTEMFAAHPDLPKQIVQWFGATLRAAAKPTQVKAERDGARKQNQFWAALDRPDGVAEAKRIFDAARAEGQLPAGYNEAIVNQLGYERLGDTDVDDAIEVFKMNVAAFPKSANAYDSLGDGYEASGETELMRESAQKCLALLEQDAALPEAQRNAIRESAERKLQVQASQ